MFSAVASGIFAVRNADKTHNGDVGRSAVTVGQTAGLVQEVAKYDGAVANSAKSALSAFSTLAKDSKFFEYAGKATQFAVNNVNPLICGSGVLKTVMSDDKIGTGVTEVSALAAMFAGEGFMKAHYDDIVNSDTCKDTLEKLSKSKYTKSIFSYLEKNKLNGKVAAIIKGLLFVGTSISSYAIGEYMGKDLSSKIKSAYGLNEPKKINLMM